MKLELIEQKYGVLGESGLKILESEDRPFLTVFLNNSNKPHPLPDGVIALMEDFVDSLVYPVDAVEIRVSTVSKRIDVRLYTTLQNSKTEGITRLLAAIAWDFFFHKKGQRGSAQSAIGISDSSSTGDCDGD